MSIPCAYIIHIVCEAESKKMSVYRTKANFPAFDLCWLTVPLSPLLVDDVHTTADGPAIVSYLLLAGGGGSAKSGITNSIQIATYNESKTGYDVIDYLKTDTDDHSVLCNSVSCGYMYNRSVICAVISNKCRIYFVSYLNDSDTATAAATTDDDKESVVLNQAKLKVTRFVEFESDYAAESPCVNASYVMKTSPTIVTAGDDGICRLWQICQSTNAGVATWKAAKRHELLGHKGPIMAVSIDSEEKLLCTASKDGSCKIWFVSTGAMAIDIPHATGLGGSVIDSKKSIECRGCCFSSSGESLYTLQCVKGTASNLILWSFQRGISTSNGSRSRSSGSGDEIDLSEIKAVPVKTVLVSKVPCTRLSINDCGEYIAVGIADGALSVFSSDSLKKTTHVTCHDFSVTGIGFAPTYIADMFNCKAVLSSCSVDNCIGILRVSPTSTVYIYVLISIISLLFTLVLAYMSYILFVR